MPYSVEGKLVVAISSRALFDFEEENRVFEHDGEPAYIALQMHDWPDVGDSGPFFLSQPALLEGLKGSYHQVPAIEGFQMWERNGR